MESAHDELFEQYSEELIDALYDESIRIALRRAVLSYKRNLAQALEKYPETRDLAKRVRLIKEASLKRLRSLIKETMEAIEDNGGVAYLASSSEEAREIIGDIVGKGKVVVKGKSLTSEEIGLTEYLEELGNEVYETDLGEFLVQRMGIRPMHILSPAIHVPREKVAEVLSSIAGHRVKPEISEEVKFVRKFLRDKFIKADVGITGANVISADTGLIFLIENEGNIRFVSNAPPRHIVLAGVEKLVPTTLDAMMVSEVTWRYAGYNVPSYVSIIGGPSKTGDIEKTITYGAHGPKELHVVLLDNGRLRISQDERFREALLCLRCGGCLYECPVYRVVAGHFGDKYFGGIGAIWTAFIAGGLEKGMLLAYTCTLCERCKLHCPMEIDIPRMVLELRRLLVKRGLIPSPVKAITENILKHGSPYFEMNS